MVLARIEISGDLDLGVDDTVAIGVDLTNHDRRGRDGQLHAFTRLETTHANADPRGLGQLRRRQLRRRQLSDL